MNSAGEKPLILGFVADLMAAARIESAASRLDFQARWIAAAGEIAPQEEEFLPRQTGEHLDGQGATLLDRVTLWKPALILFDLGNAAIPWREWIQLLTSVPATRRIPVICFGPHVDSASLEAARAAGATLAIARSRFFRELPQLLRQNARIPPQAALAEACRQPLSEEARRGLEEFNQGRYFEAHESLESAWMADETPGRELYRAILQVAVAYYQITRRNYRGAAKMFLRLRQWLDPLPETCRGVEVARLRSDARAAHQALLQVGPERIAEFDLSLLRPVIYAPAEKSRPSRENHDGKNRADGD